MNEDRASDDSVSVIVTTRNSIRTIEPCIRSIRAQDHPRLEIVLVDNRSDDGTLEAAAPLVDVLIAAGPERSAQRNVGIAGSRGRYVLVVDSDMILQPGVIGEAVRISRRTGAQAIGIPERSFGQGFWARCKALERSLYPKDEVLSGARFFARDHLLGIGGYDENLVLGEDWDLSLRAAGGRLTAFTDALILHDEGKLRLSDVARKKFYYGRFLLGFVRKHGRAALARLNPARGALLRGFGILAASPPLAAGLLVMKSTEAVAGVSGMVYQVAAGVLWHRLRRPLHRNQLLL